MGVFEIEAPDGKVYEVEAPDMQAAAQAFKPVQKQQPANTPSIYSQFPKQLENPMGMAATLGASDAQMGDIVKKNLGDKFIRMESETAPSQRPTNRGGQGAPVGGGEYPVIVYRGEDGQEKRAYLNKPGLDSEDIVRGVRGALPYAVGGAGAAALTRGAPLLMRAAGEGAMSAGMSAAGDLAQIPLGSEQGVETGKAVGMGLMGMGIPLASRAVGNIAGALSERMAPQTGPLAGMNKRAVRNIEESIASDPSITRPNVNTMAQTFGPETMVADFGATLQSDAAMMARTPIAKDVAQVALQNRQGGAQRRIADALNTNMGPDRNLPEYISTRSKMYNQQARPFYQQFENSPILASSRLKEIMARVPRSAFSEAEKLARADGVKQKFKLTPVDDPMTAMTGVRGNKAERVVQGREYDYLKRAIDDLAKNAKPGSNEQRIYGNLARDLRTEVDEILSPGNPAGSPWAIARSIAGEGLEGKEAAELGSTVFGPSAKDPHLVATELDGMSAYGKDMYREGGRNKLRQVMGRAASNFGPKGDTAARRALNSEFSNINMEQVTSPNAARNIADRIEGENHFARLHDLALGNSATDTMQAARRRWAPHAQGDFASEAGKKGPMGLLTEALMRFGDKAIGGQIKKAEVAAMVDGAKILTAQGKQRDAIVDALFKHMQARQAGRMSGQKYEAIVKSLLDTGKAPALQYYQGTAP
jgi:hypothetical protein